MSVIEENVYDLFDKIHALEAKTEKKTLFKKVAAKLSNLRKSYEKAKQKDPENKNLVTMLTHLNKQCTKAYETFQAPSPKSTTLNIKAKEFKPTKQAMEEKSQNTKPQSKRNTKRNKNATKQPINQTAPNVANENQDAPNSEVKPTRKGNGKAKNQRKGKNSNGTEKVKNSNTDNTSKKKKNKKQNRKWWSTIEESDPITMEPIAHLQYPPFELKAEDVHMEDSSNLHDVVHYFDGKVLAQYIVSTGSFLNPNTRQPLTRETCRRLDKYLRDHRLGKPTVTDAYDLSKVIAVEDTSPENESARNRADALRREATVLLGNLFDFQHYSDNATRNNSNNQRSTRNRRREPHSHRNTTGSRGGVQSTVLHQEGNLMVMDGDSWEALESVENTFDFPSISNALSAVRQPSQPQSWAVNVGGAAPRMTASANAFPSLQGDEDATTASVWSRETAPSAILNPPTSTPAAKPKTQTNHSWRVIPTSQQTSVFASRPANVPVHRNTQGLLCPYLPYTFALAREFGLNWVSAMEAKLFEFLRAGNTERNLMMGEMNPKKRHFLHELCQHYWALETTSMYREPHREICVNKIAGSCPPEITLVQAMMDFENDLLEAKVYTKLSNARGGNNAIGLWNIVGPGGSRPSTSQLYQAFDRFARQSEYNIVFLEGNNLLLEFANHTRARKVHAALVSTFGKLGIITFQRAQWWPCGSEWAEHQLHVKFDQEKNAKQQEKVSRQLEMQIEQTKQSKEEMKTMVDAWDSDDEEGFTRIHPVAKNKLETTSLKNTRSQTVKSVNENNIWDAFGSSDEDE